MELVPCGRCRRHINVTSERCIFCEAPNSGALARLVEVGARASRAAVFAGLAACYTNAPAPQQQVQPPPPPPPDDTVQVQTQFAQPPVDAGAAPVAENGGIKGSLVDGSSNRPLANTTVWLQDVDGGRQQTTTDTNGHFRFDNLPPGNYVVWTEERGGNPRVPPPRQMVAVAAGKPTAVMLATTPYVPDRGPCCKPYGAPPARRRVV